MSSKNTKFFLITIDVEDWFQVENFKPWIPFSTWDERELRVEKNVHRLLDLFDSVKLKSSEAESSKLKAQSNELSGRNKPSQHSQLNQPRNPSEADLTGAINSINTPKATFFILGWIAEKLPHLVREIHSRGHEVASHGYNHELPNSLSAKDLKNDLINSKKLLEDITGAEVVGYRAPSFAVIDGVLKTIEDCGFLYDSSYNSFDMHGRYGKISLNITDRIGITHKISENFFELPISNFQLGRWTFPLGGGGYFRLLPTPIFTMGIRAVLKRQEAFVFYAHPWEFDPNQPRLARASFKYKFRHYLNLNKTNARLSAMIKSFDQCRFVTCSEYLNTF